MLPVRLSTLTRTTRKEKCISINWIDRNDEKLEGRCEIKTNSSKVRIVYKNNFESF